LNFSPSLPPEARRPVDKSVKKAVTKKDENLPKAFLCMGFDVIFMQVKSSKCAAKVTTRMG
jgi:hypothetical protein